MEILNISNLEKELSHGILFKDINLVIDDKDKIGIVGKNGAGKSTLLKMIVGKENITSGNIAIKKGLKIGFYEQNLESKLKVKDILVLDCLELIKMKDKLNEYELKMQREQEVDFDKYLSLQNVFSNNNGYELDGVINKVCNELELAGSIMEKNFDEISGGQRARVLLAKVLIGEPDLLVLDEPLNHLDMKMIFWLEEYLKKTRKAMLIVSHDRYFLDNVVTSIIEIKQDKVDHYAGNYSFFVNEKENRNHLQNESYKRQQKEIKRLEESAKKLKQWAIQGDNEQLHKASRNIYRRIDKLDKVEKVVEESMNLNLNAKVNKNFVIRLENFNLEKYDNIFLQDINLTITSGDKIVLMGGNGCGKSTFLDAIINDEELDGKIKNQNLKFAKINQHIIFDDKKMSILDYFQVRTGFNNTNARSYLAKYLFKKESVFKLVGDLSGGEAVRLEFAILSTTDNDVIILDEPTNNMDIKSREKLEEVLSEFVGTLIIVSHDRYFIGKVAQKTYEFNDKKLVLL